MLTLIYQSEWQLNFGLVCGVITYKENRKMLINSHLRFSSYSKRDLNPHSRNGQGILSPSCLPIPPFEQPYIYF